MITSRHHLRPVATVALVLLLLGAGAATWHAHDGGKLDASACSVCHLGGVAAVGASAPAAVEPADTVDLVHETDTRIPAVPGSTATSPRGPPSVNPIHV